MTLSQEGSCHHGRGLGRVFVGSASPKTRPKQAKHVPSLSHTHKSGPKQHARLVLHPQQTTRHRSPKLRLHVSPSHSPRPLRSFSTSSSCQRARRRPKRQAAHVPPRQLVAARSGKPRWPALGRCARARPETARRHMACPSSTLAAQGSRQHARSCPPQAARNGTLARQAQVWGAWLANKQKGYLWNLNQAEVERTNGSAQQKFLGCRSFCSLSKCDGARNLKG